MQSKEFTNNHRIVKNTLFLYFRMFITVLVGLYTSRVVLNVLGTSDFGTYSLVGGIVLMASFLNTGMMQSSQRFISCAIGKGNYDELRKAFSASVYTHIAIAVIVIIVSETLGLYIVQILDIPSNRMCAANWVYQCSIFSFVVSVLSVPYNSTIVAHEHMNFYAYISILEVILKLVVVYLLLLSFFDKLITYAVLLICVQLLIRLIYTIYCSRHFEECRQKLLLNKGIMLEMFQFAGWSVLGNMGFSFRDQGTNIILNKFFGVTIGLTMNAARGIATHISSIINSFSTNVTMAINPPIVKNYAAGHIEQSAQLVYVGSRLSFFLLSFLTIPFLINVDDILELWLGDVPENTSLFVAFVIFTSLLYAMSQPVTVAIQATGRIKIFQIWIFSLMIIELVATYAVLAITSSLFYALIPSIITNLAALIVRFVLIKKMVPLYSWHIYGFDVFLRCWAIFGLCYFSVYLIHSRFNDEGLLHLIIETLLYALIVGGFIFAFGLKSIERSFVLKKIPFIKSLCHE